MSVIEHFFNFQHTYTDSYHYTIAYMTPHMGSAGRRGLWRSHNPHTHVWRASSSQVSWDEVPAQRVAYAAAILVR